MEIAEGLDESNVSEKLKSKSSSSTPLLVVVEEEKAGSSEVLQVKRASSWS